MTTCLCAKGRWNPSCPTHPRSVPENNDALDPDRLRRVATLYRAGRGLAAQKAIMRRVTGTPRPPDRLITEIQETGQGVGTLYELAAAATTLALTKFTLTAHGTRWRLTTYTPTGPNE